MVTIVHIHKITDRDKLVKDTYENVDTGYGSVKDTFDQLKLKDSSIKYTDVHNIQISKNIDKSNLNIEVRIHLCQKHLCSKLKWILLI